MLHPPPTSHTLADTIAAKSKSFEEAQAASKEEKRALKEEHVKLREEISVARHVADDEKKKSAAETARVAGIELAKQVRCCVM